MRIDQLQRAHNADPQSEEAKTRLAIQRARTEGPQVYLEPLMDRKLWNRTNPGLQDQATLEVARRLWGKLDFKGPRVWSCPVQHWTECKACKGEKGRHSERAGRWIGCFYCQEKGRVCLRIPESHRLALFTHAPTGIEFSLLPGCRLAMKGRAAFSIKPFLVARWPVTYGQMINRASLDIAGREDYFNKAGDEDLPYTGLSFDFLKEHLPKLGFDLPTPEQWEYACRAGASTRYYWGDEFDESYVWYSGNSGWEGPDLDGHMGEPQPHAPKEHDEAVKWNAFGLVDMIGNVWEWSDNASAKGGSYLSEDPFSDSLEMSQTGMFVPYEESGENLRTIGFRPIVAVPGLED